MKQNPKISVIIPIYNTAKYLPTCLDSVINQTYRNLEIILINDGSTDNSSKIIDNYAKKDPRIKVIHQKNAGLSGARNTGIQKSTGDFLLFIDSDDSVDVAIVEKMVNSLQKSHSNIAICSFKEIYPSGKITYFNSNFSSQIFTTEKALKAMLKEQGFMLSATMKLFPKSYFKNLEFPLNKLHEDVIVTYKLIMQAHQIVFVAEPLYNYIHHKNSIISQKFDDHKLDLVNFTDQMCRDIDQKFPNLKNITNERRIRARFSILRQIPSSNPHTKSIINYLKSHKNYIVKNPEATKADYLALKLSLISPNLLKLAYKLFK